MMDESVRGYSADGKDRPIPGHPCTYVARHFFFFELLDLTSAHKWFYNSPRSSLRQDPLEAILVIFGRRALIFFV